MIGVGQNLTPTQIKAHERSKAFRAHIERMAALLKEPPVPVHQNPPKERSQSEKPHWFEIVEKPIHFGEDNPSLVQISHAVTAYYKISRNDLFSARRTADLIIPRKAMSYLCKHLTLASLPQIGRYMGGKDHTTILHAIRRATVDIRHNWEFAFDIAALTKTLIGDQPQ